jgi:hypothetical protein
MHVMSNCMPRGRAAIKAASHGPCRQSAGKPALARMSAGDSQPRSFLSTSTHSMNILSYGRPRPGKVGTPTGLAEEQRAGTKWTDGTHGGPIRYTACILQASSKFGAVPTWWYQNSHASCSVVCIEGYVHVVHMIVGFCRRATLKPMLFCTGLLSCVPFAGTVTLSAQGLDIIHHIATPGCDRCQVQVRQYTVHPCSRLQEPTPGEHRMCVDDVEHCMPARCGLWLPAPRSFSEGAPSCLEAGWLQPIGQAGMSA